MATWRRVLTSTCFTRGLFELGFAEQLQKILDATPSSRQCLLFSATLPAQLVSFSRAGIKDPAFIRLDVETSLSESLDLWYLFVRKDETLSVQPMRAVSSFILFGTVAPQNTLPDLRVI